MKAAHTADEIAQYLLWLVANENPEDPDYLTPLKLQKLLYFVQGWHLAETGGPAFGEEIRAWRDGPVVRPVYERFSDFGKRPITDAPEKPPELAPETRAIVESVWGRYKAFSAFKLSDMTHDQSPWREARGSRARGEKSNAVISQESLRREFVDQSRRLHERLRAHAGQVRAAARANTTRASARHP